MVGTSAADIHDGILLSSDDCSSPVGTDCEGRPQGEEDHFLFWRFRLHERCKKDRKTSFHNHTTRLPREKIVQLEVDTHTAGVGIISW